MKLSNRTLDREKQKLESKWAEMEAQKSTTDQQTEQYKVRIAKLEAKNSSLEVLLKASNECKMKITPLIEHALLLRGKIYHVWVNLAKEVFQIK